jgi:hypothetical protein
MNQEKPEMIQAALIGGVFLGVASALPILEWVNCACCILVIGGGLLASFIYLRDYPSQAPQVTYGDGALLGVFTGIVGGLVWTIVEIPLAYLQLKLGLDVDDLAELEELLSDPDIPPVLQEVMKSILSGGALSVGIIVIGIIAHLLIAVVFACIGAIIGVAIFQPKPPVVQQAPAAPSTPPPPSPAPPQKVPPDTDRPGE